MAVQNRLAPQAAQKRDFVEYIANGEKVKITMNDVKNYLVSGDKDRVSVKEVVMFMNLCRFAGLNPWLREAYIIKYGNEPATMVTGKEAFMKRADANPEYEGMESGVVVTTEENAITYRVGTIILPGEQLIGGWAEVWRRGRSHSCRVEVSFDEYAGRKKDGTLNSQWAKKPATMIRKVAQVQALRETFPTMLGGMYAAEESGEQEATVIDVPEQPLETAQQPQEQIEASKAEIPMPDAANRSEAAQRASEAVPQSDVAAALFGNQ